MEVKEKRRIDEKSVSKNLEEVFQTNKIKQEIISVFNIKGEELERFNKNIVVNLIASLPFMAKCRQPERTALANLSTYMMGIRAKKYAVAKESDNFSITERIELLNNFIGGDQDIIRKGMLMLSLVMLDNYKKDIENDSKINKYNPISSGDINYDVERANLVSEINGIETTQLDFIKDITTTPYCWWN